MHERMATGGGPVGGPPQGPGGGVDGPNMGDRQQQAQPPHQPGQGDNTPYDNRKRGDKGGGYRNGGMVGVWPGVETELVAEKSRSVERIRMMMKPGMFSFAVILPLPFHAPSPASHEKDEEGGKGQVIGFLGITSPPQIFYIFSRGSWGTGYATEALRAFLGEYWGRFPGGLKTEAGSGSVGVEKDEGGDFLEAHVHDGNVGSENVLRKLGFEVVREGKTVAHGVEVRMQVYRLNRRR
ncbi:hypothetical protein CGLO_14393 [Colletotrichum gloeosporioides Cg-14]|uniref:N-acetyltransferase domain-containing protein n=1 Tax=Colletotrichum gloeosporioides (strain Cg-14) TaxID=1237896 RepID=T0K435_COLGC|nr:hypothetical protein CGLO_14393 [Colletotrichum gloeosporioides Cg-14]